MTLWISERRISPDLKLSEYFVHVDDKLCLPAKSKNDAHQLIRKLMDAIDKHTQLAVGMRG